MFRTRRRREVPALNTTSTADISFMLLIFFLVTSSMDSDKGMLRQLPPLPKEQQVMDVSQEHVMTVALDAADRLTCDGDSVTLEQLTARVQLFADGDRQEHVIAIHTHRATTFDAYFQMQQAVARAYQTLRNRKALQQYGHSWKSCSPRERETIANYYPQRIREQWPTEEGGGR